MPDTDREPLIRLKLSYTLDQGLLEVEGKSETNGRLFSNEFRGAVAASFLDAIGSRLNDSVKKKVAISLLVNRSDFTILSNQTPEKKD